MKHFTTVFKENKSIFLEFALIFAFFILPPLIQGPSVGGKISIAGGGKLSASIFVQLILTALLLLQNKFKPILPVEKKGSPLILFLMWTPICLGLCMISQAAVTGISMAIKIDAGGGYIFPASAAGSVRAVRRFSSLSWFTLLSKGSPPSACREGKSMSQVRPSRRFRGVPGSRPAG